MTISTSYWRRAGLNYLQYLSVASKATRGALKEPIRSRINAGQQEVFYNKTVGDVKTPISSWIPK